MGQETDADGQNCVPRVTPEQSYAYSSASLLLTTTVDLIHRFKKKFINVRTWNRSILKALSVIRGEVFLPSQLKHLPIFLTTMIHCILRFSVRVKI